MKTASASSDYDSSEYDYGSGSMCDSVKPIDRANVDKPGAFEYDTAIGSGKVS